METKIIKANKRVSAFIKSSDPNSYRAYKQATKEEPTKSIDRSKLLNTIRNEVMKYPFQLTAPRFKWQDNKNRGETISLNGTLSKYSFDNSTLGKWDNLMNKSLDNKRSTKSVDKRLKENRESMRTLTPLNTDFYLDHSNKVYRKSSIEVSPSFQSKVKNVIANEFDSVPGQMFSFKKHHEKRNLSSIFSEEFNKITPIKTLRKNFDFDLLKKENYAGVKTEAGDNSYSGLNINKKKNVIKQAKVPKDRNKYNPFSTRTESNIFNTNTILKEDNYSSKYNSRKNQKITNIKINQEPKQKNL